MGSASLSGDTRALSKLADKLSRIAGPGFTRNLNANLAQTAHSLTISCFREGKSPYGAKWAKPKSRPGGLPLQDTRRLMNSINYRPNDTGFVGGSNLIYASVHNYGAVIRPVHAKFLKFRVGGARGGKTQRAGGQKGGGESWVQVKEVRIPQRQFLPNAAIGLPSHWKRAFYNQAVSLREQYLGRR